jgi:GT2 family glycosyltransferase
VVSVIIVNFNSGSALAGTLASLAAGLDGADWEAVVVDNASSDGSELAAFQYAGVRLLRQTENIGFAAGMNAGLAATAGSHVLLLNPDCRLDPGSGGILLKELRGHGRCALIAPMILDPAGTLQENARGDPDILTGLFGRTSLLSRIFPGLPRVRRNLVSSSLRGSAAASHSVDWVSGACMMARRDGLEEIGGFDEGYFLYWEDADLCRRLRRAGWEIRYTPLARAVHDVGQSSRTAKKLANEAFHRSAYRYFARWVAPTPWHPLRFIGWTILMLRYRIKSRAG